MLVSPAILWTLIFLFLFLVLADVVANHLVNLILFVAEVIAISFATVLLADVVAMLLLCDRR